MFTLGGRLSTDSSDDLSAESEQDYVDPTQNTPRGRKRSEKITPRGKEHRVRSESPKDSYEALEDSHKGLEDPSMNHQNDVEPPPYENVHVMMLSWDVVGTEIRQEVQRLERLFVYTFKYQVHHLRMVWNSTLSIGNIVRRCCHDLGSSDLLIFYYKGQLSYSQVRKGFVLHSHTHGWKEEEAVAWQEIQYHLAYTALADTLVLLDCNVPSSFQTDAFLHLHETSSRVVDILLPGPQVSQKDSLALTTFIVNTLIDMLPMNQGAPVFSAKDIIQRSADYSIPWPELRTYGHRDRDFHLHIKGINPKPKGRYPNTFDEATQRMARILWGNSALADTATEAVSKFGWGTFLKNLGYILEKITERASGLMPGFWTRTRCDPMFREHSVRMAWNLVGDDDRERNHYGSKHGVETWDDMMTNRWSRLTQKEVNELVQCLTDNKSTEVLHAYLFCINYPEKSVQYLLSTENFTVLADLLEVQFDEVAIGDFAWLQELKDAGHTTVEIANLLIAEAAFSPWIVFEPLSTPELNLDLLDIAEAGHAANCVHEILGDTHVSYQSSEIGTAVNLNMDEKLIEEIQESTGLAGVVPIGDDRSKWNGTAVFDEHGTTAKIFYGKRKSRQNLGYTLKRAMISTNRFLHAFSLLQSACLCCNTFTVVVQPFPLSDDYDTSAFELRHIEVKTCLAFARCLDKIAGTRLGLIAESKDIQECVNRIFSVFGQHNFNDLSTQSPEDAIHMIALAAQFLSLGFLLYNQAHMGQIHPFFLDQALTTIYLTGMGPRTHKRPYIVVEPVELTCVGDMLQSSVMAFRMENPTRATLFSSADRRFDLVTTTENILDTWGPGKLIISADHPKSPISNQLRGIRICGGLIYCVEPQTQVYHWSKDATMSAIKPVSLDPKSYMRIGALVTENPHCLIDVSESWSCSHVAFEYLGAQESSWVHDESQIGTQAGQYLLLQYNRTRHKIPGKTLKQLLLEYDERMVLLLLDNLWGLQVSFCTGVARRVPLRLLIADLLPVFATNLPDTRYPWEELNSKYNILSFLQTRDFHGCLAALPEDVISHLRGVIRQILTTLQPTGIDKEGKFLIVAWPYAHPPYPCFKIPCQDQQNSWVRVLADSTDCATFAYVTTLCLETHNVECRGPKPLWNNTSPVLETAIIRHNEKPSEPLGPLEHKKMYFFKKMDDMLQVTVERRQKGQSNEEVCLYVQSSSIPARFRQRIQRMEIMKRKDARIKERRERSDLGAEQVVILSKSESG